jgi:hypothetical protein
MYGSKGHFMASAYREKFHELFMRWLSEHTTHTHTYMYE